MTARTRIMINGEIVEAECDIKFESEVELAGAHEFGSSPRTRSLPGGKVTITLIRRAPRLDYCAHGHCLMDRGEHRRLAAEARAKDRR